jgi:hypothetical protein
MKLLPKAILHSGLLLLACAGASAQEYKAQAVATPLPQELSAAVRDALAPGAIQVTGPQGPLCEIWLRKVVPAKASPLQELGVAFGQITDGTLVGALRFPREVKDYRRQKISPGVYTLRYALIPVDGNHQGVAPNRDFLLLTPAALDLDAGNVTRDALIANSRKGTSTNHPSVWSLQPPENAASLPAMLHVDDGDLWLVAFRVQTQAGSAAPAPLVLALVVVGHAPEA